MKDLEAPTHLPYHTLYDYDCGREPPPEAAQEIAEALGKSVAEMSERYLEIEEEPVRYRVRTIPTEALREQRLKEILDDAATNLAPPIRSAARFWAEKALPGASA